MKKLVVFLLIGMLILSACSTVDMVDPKIEKLENISFIVEENKYLAIENKSEKYYLSSEISKDEIKNQKDIGIIFKASDGIISIQNDFKDFSNKQGMTAMINGADLSLGLGKINDVTYKLIQSDEKKDSLLDLNSLFENITKSEELTLSTGNYEEFVDKNGNTYYIGEELSVDNIEIFLYPVNLNGKDIYTITFNKENGKIYGAKEKTTMLTDGKEAENIKTINYKGIFQTKDGEVAVGIDEKYYELLAK